MDGRIQQVSVAQPIKVDWKVFCFGNCCLGYFQGFNNDFKEAMDQVDQDYLKEILKTTSSGFSELTDVKIQDDGTTYEEVMVVLFCMLL